MKSLARGAYLAFALSIATGGCNRPAPTSTVATPARVFTVESRCAALCEHVAECGPPEPFEGVPACSKVCADDPRHAAAPCRDPMIAYELCAIALSCADTRTLRVATPAPACPAERKAVLACEPHEETPFIYFQF
jgi:hypothetical protein